MYIDKIYTKLYSNKDWNGLEQLVNEIKSFARKDYKYNERGNEVLKKHRDAQAKELMAMPKSEREKYYEKDWGGLSDRSGDEVAWNEDARKAHNDYEIISNDPYRDLRDPNRSWYNNEGNALHGYFAGKKKAMQKGTLIPKYENRLRGLQDSYDTYLDDFNYGTYRVSGKDSYIEGMIDKYARDTGKSYDEVRNEFINKYGADVVNNVKDAKARKKAYDAALKAEYERNQKMK